MAGYLLVGRLHQAGEFIGGVGMDPYRRQLWCW